MKFPVLYKSAKAGENVQWEIHTTADVIIEKYGRVGGKMQINTRVAKPTNVGRANERDTIAQAEFEAKAKWQLKIDKGYRENQEEVDDVPMLPMLAAKFEERKAKVKYPVYVQPKLNGVRAMGSLDKKAQLMSRGGKDYDVAHIATAVAEVLKGQTNLVLDGEIYLHRTLLQNIISLVKKPKDGSCDLQYWIYDIYDKNRPDMPQNERIKLLNTIDFKGFKCLVQVKTILADSEDKVREIFQQFMLEGFEGAMIRLPETLYEVGHRSNGLLKLKTFVDDEFEIIGHEVGEKDCIVWKCLSKTGLPFKVFPEGPISFKQELLKQAQSYYHKSLTVRYQELSKDGIPIFPVGVSVRLEEDK